MRHILLAIGTHMRREQNTLGLKLMLVEASSQVSLSRPAGSEYSCVVQSNLTEIFVWYSTLA